MNRKDFQGLAEKRIEDANLLFRNSRFDGVYYLAGSHNLPKLVEAAGLSKVLQQEWRNDSALDLKWGVVKDWNEESRDKVHGRKKAKGLLDAVSAPTGVLACLKKYW